MEVQSPRRLLGGQASRRQLGPIDMSLPLHSAIDVSLRRWPTAVPDGYDETWCLLSRSRCPCDSGCGTASLANRQKPSVAKRYGDAAHSDELSFDDPYELQIQPAGGSGASD